MLVFISGVVVGAIIVAAIVACLMRGPEAHVAGEDIAPGDPVYMHRDGKWYRSMPKSFDELGD